MTQYFDEIEDLRLEPNWRIDNGNESFVVPFPTTNPVNLVFHGEAEFDYGHYGIHLGQEDRLVFLGDPEQTIIASFIDCRKDSPTKGNRLVRELNPTSELCLCIPPGIAHAFQGLENIFTLNVYKLSLPEPEKWLSGETNWSFDGDVINLPMDVKDEDIIYLEPNTCDASSVYYEVIRQNQLENIPKIETEYPLTEDLDFDDGTKARLKFHKIQKRIDNVPDWEGVTEIEGVGWQKHLCYWSSDNSGFIPLLDHSPFYIVDHGCNSYTHDAYGIHLCQQDRLSFVGNSKRLVTLVLVDCREDSPTKHNEFTMEFYPDPLRFLIIPPGVAHRFENLHEVFTINRPRIFCDDIDKYEPGNDVIDWDMNNLDYPEFRVSTSEAPKEFYFNQAESQKQLMNEPASDSTPIVIAMKDEENETVRIAIRRKS